MGKTFCREKPEPRRGARLPEPAPGVRRTIDRRTWLVIEMSEDDGDDLVLLTCPVTAIPRIRRKMEHDGTEIIGRLPAAIAELTAQIGRALVRSRKDWTTCRVFFYTRNNARADRLLSRKFFYTTRDTAHATQNQAIERRLRDELHVAAPFLTEGPWPKRIRLEIGRAHV